MDTGRSRTLAFVLPLSLLLAAISVAAQTQQQQPELVVQAGHSSPVNAVSFSPDGKLLASGSGQVFSVVEVNVVKLWDTATGAELRTLYHEAPVHWVAFSADNRRVAAKGTGVVDKVRVWDVASGARLPDVEIGAEYVSRTASPDGKIGAEIDGKNIRLRDEATGRELRTLASRTSDFQKVMFSPDSTILATGGDRFSIRLWDLRSGVLRTLEGHTNFPIAAAFSPDSRLFASGGRDLSVRLWDVAGARELKRLTGHTGELVRAIHFSPDGKTLFSADKSGLKLWNVSSGRELFSAAGNFDNDFRRAVFSPRGDVLAASVGDGSSSSSVVKLWETATGRELRTLSGGGALQFSPDGKRLLVENFSQLNLWNVDDGRQIAHLRTSDPNADMFALRFVRVAFSPDSRTLAVTEYDTRDDAGGHYIWRLYLHEAATGKLRHTVEAKDASESPGSDTPDPTGSLVFSTDGTKILNIRSENEVFAWDVATGQQVSAVKKINRTNTKAYNAATFRELWAVAPHYYSGGIYNHHSPDGAFYVSFGLNNELVLYDTLTWREVVSLIGVDEQDWLVATPEGFFDGSPVAWRQILWRFDNDTFNHAPVEAFFGEFYHPGLLQDILAGRRPAPPAGHELARVDRRRPQVSLMRVEGRVGAVSALDKNAAASDMPDAAAAAAVTTRTATLALEITESDGAPARADHPRSGGARDLRLFRNGSLIKVWRGDLFAPQKRGDSSACALLPANTAGKDSKQRVRCRISVPLVAGANSFTAYAFNHANVKSDDARLTLTGAENLRRRATLHLLAVGVNQYQNERFNLRYAVADARAFAAEIKRQQERLRNFARVETTLLLDTRATKLNLRAALSELARKAQPEDTTIIYFAGHGMARENQFYLIPHDLGYAGERVRIDDEGMRGLLRHGLSDRELEESLEGLDAGQVLLVIDACNSGQALEAEEKRRGPMNSKGLAQLAYEKGMYILTAAQSFQAAQEASQLGHGLLTYALIEEGLKGTAADAEPKDGQVLLREWLDYATARVPEMQFDKMKGADAGGHALSFADGERGLPLARRSGQRPRVFYRREPESAPLLVARP